METSKLGKYLEYGTTKLKSLYKEKKFFEDGREIKYILEENKKSDTLIVIFSGIPRPGIKARYNYMRTLEKIKVNKLFILDDLGYDERGGYYLGKDKDFYMKRAVMKLTKKTKADLSINQTIYCGSSKGGWAALYFGIGDNNSSIIAGSLQYLMGSYVTSGERIRENLMKFVMGENYTKDDVLYLDNLLRDELIKHHKNTCDIYLHYSDSEYTYKDHMVHLLKDLKKFGISSEKDIAHYKGHEELSLYFPPFLVKTLKKVLAK